MKLFPRSLGLPAKRLLRSFVGLLVLVSLLGNAQSVAKASSPGKDGVRTITAANTVVNTYTSLAANAAAGSSSLSVTSAATLGVAPGDLILIIQMQGASIDSSVNTAAWGAITNYNNAGNYEFATVYSVSGNTINLSPCGPFLQRSYTAAGRVQVIRVPQYSTLTINAGASISAPAWNGTTGGVAAVVAQNTVTINGSIDVTGTGFRGGVRDNNTTGQPATVTGYAYTTLPGTTGTTAAAQKGERIARFITEYDALGGAFPGGYGRGAPANGGGGGNAHNAGGGGGANGYNGIAWNGQGNPDNSIAGWTTAWNLDGTLNSATTSSGGGRGGYTFSSINLDALTVAPGNNTWGGDYRKERGGLGGRPLINLPAGSDTSNRIFFGGGGGAGDGNNGASADGAAGGGIVFVLAPTVNGTGTINANGRDAANTVPAHNDAPGGGGGGGSVVVGTTTLSSISINAKGGKGGNQLITNAEGEGPGGGGSGGVVATSGGVAPTSVAGGANGTTASTSLTEFIPNGATAGAAGNTSTAVPSIPNQACIGVAKTVGNVTPVAGPAYDVQMIVRVANLGSEQLTNVQVTDDLNTIFSSIPGTTFAVTVAPVVTFSPGSGTISGNNAFNGNVNTNLLNPGTLDIGSTALITFTVRVTPPAGPGPFTYDNVANGSGTGAVTGATVNDASQNGTNPDPDGDGNPGNNSVPTPINLTPVIPTVAKSFAPNPVNPGVASTLTITLTNPSAADLTSAALTDNLPSGLTTVPATAATTCGGTASQTTTSVSLNGGTIPANGNCTLSVQVVGAAGGAYVNTIPAGGLTTSGGTNTADASSTLTVTDNSPVTVAKSFNPSVIPVGGVSQLTIVITNPNSVPAVLNNPGLTDTYPAGVTNTTPAVAATTCGGAVTANAGGNFVRLDAGNSVPANGSCTITVNVTSVTAGPAVTNTLGPNSVLTTNPAFINTNTATATLTVTLLPPTVTKSFGAASVPLSGTTTLTFVVTNPNSTNLTGISFTDVLPAGLTAVNGTTNNVCGGSGTMVITGGNTLTVTAIAINGAAGGASCTFNVTVTGVTAGTWNNTTGVVSSTQTGIGTTSNTATLTVTPSANLAVTKTDGSATYTPGGTTTYTIVASNAGPSNVTGATVTDTFPAAITATWTCTGAGGAICPAANGSGDINEIVNIPVGGSLTYTVTANVDASATGNLVNTATINPPVGTTDPTPGNNSATDTDTVNPVADLTITKTDSIITYIPGTPISYTVVVTNNGPSNVTGATVTDTIPANITGATWTCTASIGAGCTANGSGNINDTVTIPSGGSLTYIVSGTISGAATGPLSNTATSTVPVGTTDPTPGDNNATDTDLSSVCANGQFASWTFTGNTTNIALGAGTFTYDTVGLNAPTWPASQIAADSPAISFTGAQNAGYVANSDYVDFAVPTNGRGAITMSFIDYRSATGPDSFVVYYSTDGATYNALPPGTVYAIADTAWTARSIDFSAIPGLNNNPNARFRLYAYRVAAGGGPLGTWRFDNVSFSGNCLADLGVTKNDGTANVVAGGTTTYTVVVTNHGPSAADNTVFTDPVVPGLSATGVTCGSETGGAVCPTVANTTVALMQGAGIVIPTLPSGGSVTFTVTVDVTAANGTVANTANIAPPVGITDPGTFPNSATDTDTVTPLADLIVTKTNGVANVAAGGTTTYTLTLTNNGPSAADNATISDPAAPGLTKTAIGVCTVSGGAVCPTVGAGIGEMNIANLEAGTVVVPTLPSGGSISFTVTVDVTAASGNVSNTFTATPPAGITDPSPATVTDTDAVSLIANLVVTKTNGVASVDVGGTTTYTVTLTNNGPSAADNATISDPAAPGLTKTAIGACTAAGGAVCPTVGAGAGEMNIANLEAGTVVVPTLPSGGSISFTVTVNVTAASGSVSNTFTATPPPGTTDPTPATVTDTDTVNQIADLSLTKTVNNSSPKLGDNVVFTLTLTNAGPSVATNVSVTDSLPVGLTFISANPSAGTTFANPVWTIPSLAVGSSATLQITATVTQVGSTTNTAQVTASDQADPDSTTGNNVPTEDDQASVTIGGIFDPPSAIKTFDASGLPELEFRMVWINSSNTAAIDVQVTDEIPVGTTYVAGSVTCAPQGSSFNVPAATLPLSATAVPNSFCGYDSVANRIQWQGTIGPDDGNLTEAAAANEVVITFRVTVNAGVNQVMNQGFSRTDVDADTSFVDETVLGTSIVSSNQVIWNRNPSNPGDPGDDDDLPGALPATGFAPNVVTALPIQPNEKAYAVTDVWLEIPGLGLKVPIVGVPLVDEKWNLTWLDDQAGWLAGTAFPSWKGNSALTGHVTLSNGKPGPFAELGSLKWNDRIIIHAYGYVYVYQVRENRIIAPNDTSVLKHEDDAWLTLITCKGYNEASNSYANRVSVRAVFLSAKKEGTDSPPSRGR